jgi:hypothetical protein
MTGHLRSLGCDAGNGLEVERPRNQRVGIVAQEQPAADREQRRRGDGAKQTRSPEGLEPRLDGEHGRGGVLHT